MACRPARLSGPTDGGRCRTAARSLVHARAGVQPEAGPDAREMLLGEPVLLGRMRDGQAFAMRDICPHRGVPLSAGGSPGREHGRMPLSRLALSPRRCLQRDPFAGRRSGPDYRIEIPCTSLSPARAGRADLGLYPGEERTTSEPARVPITDARPRWTETQEFPCGIDHAGQSV